jgi:hypothetical protein
LTAFLAAIVAFLAAAASVAFLAAAAATGDGFLSPSLALARSAAVGLPGLDVVGDVVVDFNASSESLQIEFVLSFPF